VELIVDVLNMPTKKLKIYIKLTLETSIVCRIILYRLKVAILF